MKKNFIVLILVLAVAVCFGSPVFADVTLKGGLDMMGSYEISGDGEDDGDVDMGFFLGGEFTTGLSPLISLGGGLTYQLERQMSDADGDDAFNFVPIYLLVHLNFPAALVDFFGAAHVGYNLFLANDDFKGEKDLGGGLYYAIGGGVKLPMGLQFELLYAVNNGTVGGTGWEVDLAVSQISLSVGLNF